MRCAMLVACLAVMLMMMMGGAEGKPATYLVETADEPGPDRGNLGPPKFERGAELSQGIIIILYIFSLIEVLN